ncbi:hemolymph lipopolysaccharide-binding protein [Anabrus simplex]|uniref:hemolymph lipopolysaccharide-binding protein n=1 Tax=Anabrus simplex TaxID=316456 RepID=UPI0035A3ADCB
MAAPHRSLPLYCAVLLTMIFCNSYALAEKCGLNTEFNIIVTSRRNRTGHWITSFEAEKTEPTRTSKEISINVTQSTSSCHGLETYKLTSTATVSNHVFRPPSDYELVDEQYYYKLPHVAVSWHDARTTCEKDGAHLLIINSEDEALTVKRYRDRKPKLSGDVGIHDTWVGISDEEKEGEFKTIFGQPFASTGYPKWQGGSPQDGTSFNCVYFSTWKGYLGLAVRDCKKLQPFICEFDVLLSPSS